MASLTRREKDPAIRAPLMQLMQNPEIALAISAVLKNYGAFNRLEILQPYQMCLLLLSYAWTTASRGTSLSHGHAEDRLITVHVTIADIYFNPLTTSLVINPCNGTW